MKSNEAFLDCDSQPTFEVSIEDYVRVKGGRKKLGVADLLQNGPCTAADLAGQLEVNQSALHRVLRALASQGIFEESSPRTFVNNPCPATFAPECQDLSGPW